MGAAAFAKYLSDQQQKDLLRFITCGSVDDGKSTLIGRLLHDSGSVAEDVVAAARADSARWGTQGSELDLALLVDGLQSEREQGITIDVAHRYFDTPRRKFILADTPGHEQYTRNMATGASGADLAILLVDAAKGLQAQTRRHAYIVRLLGIRHVIVATNKMDAIGYDRARYAALEREAREAFERLGFERLEFIPVSALRGDLVVRRTAAMPWYEGPTLLEALEAAPSGRVQPTELRLPVQYVSRPDATFRGYAGTIAAGTVAVGDAVVALPSGARSVVTSIAGAHGPQDAAETGESVMLTLADAIDLGRGQVLASPAHPPVVTKRFAADVVWMAADALVPGRAYEFKFAHRYVPGTTATIEHRVDVHDYSTRTAEALALNDVGRCEFELAEAVALDLYDEHETTGSFIVIDRDTHATVGAGLVRRTAVGRLVAAATPVTRERRAAQKRQRPLVLWFTGLSGAGKSTIAAALEQALVARGHHTYLLDGDRVRQGLNRDLGFGELDRRENLRRIAEVARTLADAGLVTIVACISPLRADRARARELLGADFVEVHVDASLEVCEARDPKGHYRRARSGALRDFTGVDAPYEAPETPELRLDTVALDVEAAVEATLAYLDAQGRLRGDGAESDWAI